MTYTYICDLCDGRHDESPAWMGELRETWLKTTPEGGELTDAGYKPGVTVTVCPECTVEALLN